MTATQMQNADWMSDAMEMSKTARGVLEWLIGQVQERCPWWLSQR